MMEGEEQKIEIQSSRKKLAGMVVGALLFVSAGVWFVLKPHDVVIPFLSDPAMVRIVGIISIVFFGLAGLLMLKRLSSKRPAVIISDQGIISYTDALGLGLIEWKDVTAVHETVVMNQKFMSIEVSNPDYYINRQPNSIKRRLIQVNYKQYGSILTISANGLQCHHHQLKTLLENTFHAHKVRSKQV